MYDNELMHYGVKGMKWGVRRYYNADGSLNDKGVKRYAKKQYSKESFNSNKTIKGKMWDAYTGAHKVYGSAKYEVSSKSANKAAAEKYLAEKSSKSIAKQPLTPEQKSARRKKAIKVGAAVAGTALAAYGAYKISNVVKDKAYNKLMDEGRGVVERNMARYRQNSIDNIRSYKRYANKTYGKVDQDKLSEMISKAGVLEADHRKQLEERLENHARRNSKTVVRAIKTLRGKN